MNNNPNQSTYPIKALSESIESLVPEQVNQSINRISAALESLTMSKPSPPASPRSHHLLHADTLGEMYSWQKYTSDMISYELKQATDAFHSQMSELRSDQAVSTQIAVNRMISQEHIVSRVDRSVECMIKQCRDSDRYLIHLVDSLKQFDADVHRNELLLHPQQSESGDENELSREQS